MSAESEGDVAAELGTSCNLGKTMVTACTAWRCPHQSFIVLCYVMDVNRYVISTVKILSLNGLLCV